MTRQPLTPREDKHSDEAEQWKEAALILVPFQGHDGPLSLSELAKQTGLRKSVLLRALAEAERLGEIERVGAFEWRRRV